MSTIKKKAAKAPRAKIEIEDRFVDRAAKCLKRLYSSDRPLLRAAKVRICRSIIARVAQECMQFRKRAGSLDAGLTLSDFKSALGKALSERRKEKQERKKQREERIPEPPPGYRFKDPMLTEAELSELRKEMHSAGPGRVPPIERHVAHEEPQAPLHQGDFIGNLFPA